MADDQARQVDTASDFGNDAEGTAARWKSELELAEKNQRPWVERCRTIVKRYETEKADSADTRKGRFALLWANIETLSPAVYARTPTAVVSRRWKDADDVARTASEVVERALNFQLDACDFAQVMLALRLEFLLVGRGQAWIRYVPHMVTRSAPPPLPAAAVQDPADAERADQPAAKPVEAPDGEITADAEQYDEVIWEEAVPDHVHWEDFGTNPARTWAEVRFVWRRAFMTRDELIARFGDDKGKRCPLDWKANSQTGETDKDTQFSKAAVYEIWDKVSRKVFWVCKAFPEVLDEREDPLGLKDFFPCPRPLLGTCGPNSIIPTPDYVYYETQAREINDLTARISKLTDALKVKGFYAATEGAKLIDMFAADTNTLMPIESWKALQDKGGLSGIIEWFPVDTVANVLKSCIETRQQMLEDVYQITGIADIMRGDTEPDETAAAQQLKSDWGSSRVRDKQKELARFARDLIRLMGEVIASKFSTDILQSMTNIKLLPSPQAKQQIQAYVARQQAQAAQAAQMEAAAAAQSQPQQTQSLGQPGGGGPPATPPPVQLPPDLARMMSDPTWAEVEQLLRDNALRSFRIEIETDSTIEPNDDREKAKRIEFIEALGAYLEKTTAVSAAAGPSVVPVVMEGLKFLVRGFRVGREMEDVIEQAADAIEKAAANAPPPGQQQQPKDPAAMMKGQAAMTTAQANTVRAQADMLRARADVQGVQAGAQIDMARVQAEDQRSAADRASDEGMHAQDLRADLHKAALDAITRQYSRTVRDPHLVPPEVTRQ